MKLKLLFFTIYTLLLLPQNICLQAQVTMECKNDKLYGNMLETEKNNNYTLNREEKKHICLKRVFITDDPVVVLKVMNIPPHCPFSANLFLKEENLVISLHGYTRQVSPNNTVMNITNEPIPVPLPSPGCGSNIVSSDDAGITSGNYISVYNSKSKTFRGNTEILLNKIIYQLYKAGWCYLKQTDSIFDYGKLFYQYSINVGNYNYISTGFKYIT